MKSFRQYLEARGIEMPKGEIPGSWFADHGYLMIVRCTCCDMTMAIPSAYVDDDSYVFCSDCAEDIEEDED